MERFVKGDVVVIPFPFSDLTGAKHRPAFVVIDLLGDDIIFCQITSTVRADPLLSVIYYLSFVYSPLRARRNPMCRVLCQSAYYCVAFRSRIS